MPSFITKTERDTLKCALGGINSYLNFVDEAEDRSDGNVSVPERAMHAWVTTINNVIDSIDHRNKERLESIPEHYHTGGTLHHGACSHARQGNQHGDAADGHFLVGKCIQVPLALGIQGRLQWRPQQGHRLHRARPRLAENPVMLPPAPCCETCRWWRERYDRSWCKHPDPYLRAVRDTTICEDYQERRGEDWCSLVYGNRAIKHL